MLCIFWLFHNLSQYIFVILLFTFLYGFTGMYCPEWNSLQSFIYNSKAKPVRCQFVNRDLDLLFILTTGPYKTTTLTFVK